MSAIGGYFELELKKRRAYHDAALSLNSGRNCLEYIMRTREYKKLFLPSYLCHSLFEPLKRTRTKHEIYPISIDLEPVGPIRLKEGEALLYINYFGIKGRTVRSLKNRYNNLVIDNSQAFFSPPIAGIDTFYSTRKFFGVPDGGYLYTDVTTKIEMETDQSHDRCGHLLKRIDVSAEAGYENYGNNERTINDLPLKRMSVLTKQILSSLNYGHAKKRREANFQYLHSALKKKNELKIDIDEVAGPMVYPFLIKNDLLRRKLIEEKIYVATYWPEMLAGDDDIPLEKYLANYLIPLPIDHRYGLKEMKHIIQKIENILS